MASNTTTQVILLDDSTQTLNVITGLLTVLGIIGNLLSLLLKVCLKFVIPPTWKTAIFLGDVANVFLGIGLSLFLSHASNQSLGVCNAAGFFMLFAILDCLTAGLLSVVILQYIQNPVKISHFSNYSKGLMFILIIPPKLIAICIAFLPHIPVNYFNTSFSYSISCFPLREAGVTGSEFGAIVFVLLWIILAVSVGLCISCAFKLWRSSLGRIHASSPDLWQTQLLGQGKTFQKFLLLEQTIWVISLFLLTLILYTNTTHLLVPQWIVFVTLSVVTTLHCIFSHLQTALWSTLCCSANRKSKEPYQRLKKLQLIRVEETSKLRMKASWSLHKGVNKSGLLKVYGVNHMKAWSQEIVILGMLRKSHHPSILHCLWTSTSNPFYETMTLISGEIITADSRLICMELTNSGSLHKFLADLDIPLPEACQQTILHDVAEGLSCLHEQNILHNNLSSFSIYLKGSIQCLVLRASLGDFEHAQIYGSLQSGGSAPTSISKKQFFLPDIRAFALVALEILGVVCEKKLQVQSTHRKVETPTTMLPENGAYYNFERPDSHLSSSIPESYRLPNQAESIANQQNHLNQQRPSSRGSQDQILRVNPPIPTQLFVKKYVSASNVSNVTSLDNHPDNRGTAQSLAVPQFRVSRALTSPIHAKDNESAGSRPLSARSQYSDHDNYLARTSYPMKPDSDLQHSSSPFYSNRPKEHEYEEIDEIAECIESDYYRKHMYPPKQSSIIPIYEPFEISKSSIAHYKPNAANSARGNNSKDGIRGNIFNVATPSHVQKKRDHVDTGRSTPNNQPAPESLPGMVDHDSVNNTPTLNDLVKAKEAAKIEGHLESYQERINRELQEQMRRPHTAPQNHTHLVSKGYNGQRPPWLNKQEDLKHNKPYPTEQNICAAVPHSPVCVHQPRFEQVQKLAASRPQTAKTLNETQNIPEFATPQIRPHTVEISCEYQNPTIRVQSAKSVKGRTALKKAIHKNGPKPSVPNFERGKLNVDLEKKYSNFKQIRTIQDTFRKLAQPQDDKVPQTPDQTERESVPINHHGIGAGSAQPVGDEANSKLENLPNDKQYDSKTSKGEAVPRQKPIVPPKPAIIKNKSANVSDYSSFSSNDSFNSSIYKQSSKTSGASLNSGEVSSLSSQAGLNSEQLEKTGYSTDTPMEDVQQSDFVAKFVDSGFDSASVNSEMSVVEGYSCSCPDAHLDKSTCLCQYSSSGKMDTDTKTSWSNTESVSSSYDSNQTLTSPVIACPDVVPQKRTPSSSPDILGPDEQYPLDKSVSQSKNQSKDHPRTPKQKDNKIFSKMHTTMLDEKKEPKQGVATKRYQELAKRGVPLRVSVVSAKQPSDGSDTLTDWSEFDSNYEAEIIEDDPEEEEVLSDSDARDFLESLDSSSSRSSVKRPSQAGSFRSGTVVHEVIREVPEESTSSTCEDESKFLLANNDNKLIQGFAISSSSASDMVNPSVVWDAERGIDGMFTKPPDEVAGAMVDPTLGLDETTIRQLVQYPHQGPRGGYRPPVPVRKGLDTQHVKYCQQMASKLNLVSFDDLMPAHVDKFQLLRDKLETEAKLGAVGVQLLDMIQKCWLHDSPPSTGQLVKQLRDPVTETEL
ncbi:hypothetical protein SNE40_008834 [Patella caerulea]|uniref:Protein kinase domain-containing protein n=1 Tax=Patella caerulea TaxID=87958 RepID=A0AAN8JTJ5_PATCE